MKTYQDYYNEWELSTESRDLSFDEWLMVLLARKEKQMIGKAIQYWDARLRELKQEIREGYDITRPKELIDFKKAMEE